MAQNNAELEAEKRRLTLEKEVLGLRQDVATAKKSLADTITPPPPTAAEAAATAKSEAEAKTAQYNAQKAAADARAAANTAELKALFGTTPESGLSGAIAVKTDAGKGESTLLSAIAVEAAAKRIATSVEPSAGDKRIVIYTGDARPRFQNWRLFVVREALVKQAFELARQHQLAAETANAELHARQAAAGAVELPAIAVAGAALEAVKNLGSFFQTDYEIGGVSVEKDDQLLVAATMQLLTAKGVKVVDPTRLAPSMTDQELVALLTPLEAAYLEAPQKAAEMDALAKALREKAAGAGVGATDKESLGNVAAAFDRAAAAWRGASTGYESLIKDLATADATGVIWAVRIAEERVLSEGLRNGDRALFLTVNSAAGGYYTKKNIWTFFGSMPFWAMGGAVVSYVLVEGKDGSVVKAGTEPVHSGYAKVMNVPALVNGRAK